MLPTILSSLARRYIDVTLPQGQGMSVRIVERPGAWLEADDLEQLSADLRQIASSVLGEGALTYGVFSGDATQMRNVIVTLVRDGQGAPVAFNALAIMELETEEVLHLGLVMVDPAFRSQNLSWVLYGLTCFLVFVRRQMRPIWISNVTQVPAVVGMVANMFSDVWPAPQGGRRSLRHLIIARQIMRDHRHVFGVGLDAPFDEVQFVIRDAYTGGSDDLKKTYDAAPKHRDPIFNAFCRDALDYDRGDDLLQLGKMDMAAMRTYLTRVVPKSQLIGLGVAAGLVGLQRLILPLIYWLDSTKHWSLLRPNK